MFKKSLSLFGILATLLLLLVMSGCGGKDFEEVHSSASGYLLEQVFPSDTWFWVSVSTLDEDQRDLLHDVVAKFTDDPDSIRDLFVESIDKNLESVSLSYIDDIDPILGEEGLRFGFGLSEDGSGDVMTHVAITLDDVAKAEDLMANLEREGRFVKKTRDDFDIYYNLVAKETSLAEEDQDVFNFSIFEDLFLISNSEDELLNMLNLARSDGGDSLWTNETYQTMIEEIPAEHVAMVYMDSQEIRDRQVEIASETAAVFDSTTTTDYLVAQVIALTAVHGGLEFDGFALGDRERLDADGETLDKLKSKKRYLDRDMPAQDLLAYFESYNLMHELNKRLEEESGYATLIQTILGVSEDDFARFLSEGYSLALHRNSGFLPGLTIMIDVSDGSLTAQAVIDALDDQISTFVGLFQFQGGAVADALSMESMEIEGGDFSLIKLDVDTVMSLYDSTGSFALPEEVQGLDLVLMYGMTEDDRFMISMYEGWLGDVDGYLSGDENYQEATDYLKKLKEGIVYVDFNALFDYLGAFATFREALSQDADAILSEYSNTILGGEAEDMKVSAIVEADSEEVAEETEKPTIVEEDMALVDDVLEEEMVMDWLEFLAPLKSFAFGSEVNQYDIRLGGVILLDEE